MLFETKTVLAFVFILFAGSVLAQYSAKTDLPSRHVAQVSSPVADDGKEVIEPYNGTYRFIFTKGVKQIFTDEIFKTIELNRKEDDEVTIILSPYCKVQILSRKKITSFGFVSYSRSYIFEN